MRRFAIYVNERFPLYQTLPLALFFGTAVALWTPALLSRRGSIQTTVLVCAALLLFLFRLRLMDDIKDHAHDSVHHPHRPAARGIVSRTDISVLLVPVFLCEITIALQAVPSAAVVFSIAAAYSGLLFWEGLSGDRLRKNFTAYIAVHEALLIPLFAYLFVLSGAAVPDMMTAPFGLLFIFLASLFFLIEVARKVRAPGDEGGGRDTYSAHYGIRGATFLILTCALAAAASLLMLVHRSGSSDTLTWVTGLAGLLVLGIVHYGVRYVHHPTSRAASTLFTYSALYTAGMLVLSAFSLGYAQ